MQGSKDVGKGRVRILSIPVNRLTLKETVGAVIRAWNEEKSCHVVTANAEMIYRAVKDKELAEIIEQAQIVTADGAGVVLASRILGLPAPERVAGFDLMSACLEEAARRSVPLYLLGAHPDVLTQAINNLLATYAGLNIVGSHHGYFCEGEEEGILKEICALKPSLLLVALGVPKQEKWIYRYKQKLPPCVAMGVGGSFDVLAGKARRAPRWMQRAGLEWFYRLLREPSRLGRMAVLPLFLLSVIIQAVKNNK